MYGISDQQTYKLFEGFIEEAETFTTSDYRTNVLLQCQNNP